MDAENIKTDPTRQTAAGPGSTTAQEFANRSAEAYDESRRAMGRAYDRTAHAVSETYDQALSYGRDNPGKTILIAFGAGLGLGLLLAGGSGRRSTRRYAEPVVNALSDIALEYFRRH
jgi:ElaB/YqjD/DUF883 family membrane-anchored ribosome-binding protein